MNTTIKDDYFVYEEEIKKSRFICHLKRVGTEDEAREFINKIKKEHYKANHNCSAFTLGENQEIQRSSDDGEPSGTAGIPMLEVLKKREIINVVAVVTRYFGGIKLGAGGLIRAYAGSVAHALDVAPLVKIVEQQEVKVDIDYSLFDNLNRFLDTQNLKLIDTQFTTEITGSIFVDLDEVDDILSKITESFNGKVSTSLGEKRFVEVDI
ncbi:YigZ family protein [Floricoccus penangensis]|uniref:YigZ family protein n=1 Tax=Floricoccus penangensis TaxID=1859475 RepID=A0A9Q5P0J9_9LACT|nr:YigZ family protein [Floricoccus penangensis]OFI46415.1 YigZ family protein [Floricoccus penangensis]